MPDLDDLDRLVTVWRQYIADNPVADNFTRGSGYVAGLKICADQLADTLERVRADA